MLTTILTSISLCLHTLATILLIGHYLLLALVYLPALKRSVDSKALPAILASVAGGARPYLFGSLLIFVVTGIYLMLVNDSYHGVGHFENAWSVLMLTKHLLIFVMVGLGLRLNNSLNAGGKLPDRFNSLLNAISASGLLVLLLTAFAQAQ